jgi:hypothetical protein
MTLLSCLQRIPDPRSRHRREYPLYGLLAVLLLAAAHGENSLRGMWLWGKAHAQQLLDYKPLGLWGNARFPALGTFWYVLQKLEPGVLEQVLEGWLGQEEAYAIDGKYLRGSKREGKEALQVVTLAGQRLGQVVRQQVVAQGDELQAALRMLDSVDLQGKIVSADAGLLQTPLVQRVVEKGGPTLAGSKTTTHSSNKPLRSG